MIRIVLHVISTVMPSTDTCLPLVCISTGYRLSIALAQSVVTAFAPAAHAPAEPLDPDSTAAAARARVGTSSAAAAAADAAAVTAAAAAAPGLSTLDKVGFFIWLASCAWHYWFLMYSSPGPCARRFAMYLFAQAWVSVGYLAVGPTCFLTGAAQVLAAHGYILLFIAISAGRWCVFPGTHCSERR